jgi:hypothetical protein
MLDRLFMPFLGIAALCAVALALAWPQGLGARSPAPFGREPVLQSAEMQAAMKRETDANARRISNARAAVRAAQANALAPGQ